MATEPSQVGTGQHATVRAQLTDAYGNAAEGDAVRWSSSGGLVEPVEGRVVRGEAEARFTAGLVPGPAWVRLTSDGPASRVAIQITGQLDRSQLTHTVLLPYASRWAVRPRGCRDVVENGSFEGASASGEPTGWDWPAQMGGVLRLSGDGAEGKHFVRFGADSDAAPPIAQEAWIADGATSAELRLWVRGGGPGAGLRLTVRSLVELGAGPVRAPILSRRVAVDDVGWDLVAVELPIAPLGMTTLEISSYGGEHATADVDLDAVSLAVCR
jgi:hypothetical protein